VHQLQTTYKGFPNIEINEVAIGDSYGQATLCVPKHWRKNPEAGASAFMEEAVSPFQARKNAGRPVEELEYLHVEIYPISDYDDGTIQGLTIDTEGFEWFVLKHLVSRPEVIAVELRGPCDYENPYLAEIEQWMADEGYVMHQEEEVKYESKTSVVTDAVYVKESTHA